MSDLKKAALKMIAAGFSVLPCLSNKIPAIPSWKEYQTRLMTPAEVEKLFTGAERIAVICGGVSGNLEVLDFDDPTTFEPFLNLVGARDETLVEKLPQRQTPSGGYHILFRSTTPVKGNQVLARDHDGQVRIETRGEGGYALSSPSPGYKVIKHSLLDCPVLTEADIEILHSTARLFDQRAQNNNATYIEKTIAGDRPGDRFNQEHPVAEMLEKYGWRQDRHTTAGIGYTRPGKENGISGVLLADTGNFYCFSTNACPLEAMRSYDAFALYVAYEHGGDYSAGAHFIAGEHGGASEKVHHEHKKEFPVQLPLPDELLPVAPFDYALLPESLQAWAEDISDRLQCPPDFVAVGIMTTLAAVIGRKVGIRPQGHTSWTVVVNLWTLIIGRPGVLKSPAIEEVLAPLKRLVAIANEEYQQVLNQYSVGLAVAKLRAEANEKAARKDIANKSDEELLAVLAVSEPEAPILRRYMTNDTSPASLGEVLRLNQNGLLIHRDELVSLLKGLDREDQAEGRGFYLTGWNGDSSYTIDRIGRGLNLYIEAVCLSLLGGTQPGRVSEYIGQAIKGGTTDDGLIQRFGLMVWPDIGGAWKNVDRSPDSKAKNQAFKVYDYLDKMNPISIGAQQDTDIYGNSEGLPYLRFDPEALALFLEWRTALEARLRQGDLHPALESHFAKYRKLIPSLALIIHLAEGNRGQVGKRVTLQALAWSEYLETHAQRAYTAGVQPDVATAKAILKRIKKGDLAKSFSSREVSRPKWSMLTDIDKVKNALHLLVEYNHLFEEQVETGGRPTTIYHFNEGAGD